MWLGKESWSRRPTQKTEGTKLEKTRAWDSWLYRPRSTAPSVGLELVVGSRYRSKIGIGLNSSPVVLPPRIVSGASNRHVYVPATTDSVLACPPLQCLHASVLDGTITDTLSTYSTSAPTERRSLSAPRLVEFRLGCAIDVMVQPCDHQMVFDELRCIALFLTFLYDEDLDWGQRLNIVVTIRNIV